MAEPFVGEVRAFGATAIPIGWVAADGSLLNVQQFPVLFAVVGTTYGGDGVNTFAVPDMRGRIPLHRNTATLPIGSAGQAQTTSLVPALTYCIAVSGLLPVFQTV